MSVCQFCGSTCQVRRTGAYAHCPRKPCADEALDARDRERGIARSRRATETVRRTRIMNPRSSY